jgi:hypothetical protein
VSEASRLRVLGESGLVHPNPASVQASLFTAGPDFFLAADKVQVKYEMLRAHRVEGQPVTEVAAAHGYSRAAFYLVSAAFEQLGMSGLLDERRGRRGPVKLHPEVVAFIRAGGRPVRVAAAPADRRAGPRPVSARSFWPPAEAAQFDYETLRDHLLEQGTLPGGLAAARFARRGLAGLIAWPAAEPLFIPEITGADRPRWSPHVDTREDVLAVCYQFLLDAATTRAAGSVLAGVLP